MNEGAIYHGAMNEGAIYRGALRIEVRLKAVPIIKGYMSSILWFYDDGGDVIAAIDV